MMKSLKLILLLVMTAALTGISFAEKAPGAASEKKAAPPPRKKMHRPHRSMRGPMMWRAFSRLSDAERKQMLELQRTNPEKFTEEMRNLALKMEKVEKERRDKVRKLTADYRAAKESKVREKIKNDLAQIERKIFQERLRDFERIIAENKKRVAFMERELKKRTANAEKIINARVDALLSGELSVDNPKPPRPYPRRHKR